MQKLAGIITEGEYRENTDEVVGPWSRNYNDGDDIVNYNTDGSNEEVPDMRITLDYDNDMTMIQDDSTGDTIESDFDPDDTLDIVRDLISKHKYNKIFLKAIHDGEELEDEFNMGNWGGINYYIK
jgi:hypothetical protein